MLHEDRGSGHGIVPGQVPALYQPLEVGFRSFRQIEQISGVDPELIEHSRGKEDALAGVSSTVGRQAPLGQLQERASRIGQTEIVLYFLKNSNSMVDDQHPRFTIVLFIADQAIFAHRMVDGVVQDFGEPVLTDFKNVLRQVFRQRQDAMAPDRVLRQPRGKLNFAGLFDEVPEPVSSRAGAAFGGQQALVGQASHVSVYRLTRQSELPGGERGDIVRVLFDIPKNELSHFRVLPAASRSCQL